MNFYYCEKCKKFLQPNETNHDFGDNSKFCCYCYKTLTIKYTDKSFQEMVIIERMHKIKKLI